MLADQFELHRPTSVEEAVSLSNKFGKDSRYLAGGTDMLPNMFKGLGTVGHLISLERIPELTQFLPSEGVVGAMVPLRTIERSAQLRERSRAVVEAAALAASPNVRSTATIGGNLLLDTRCSFYNQSVFWRDSLGNCLKTGGEECQVVPNSDRCYAVFAGDLAPPLMVLGATVDVVDKDGRRRMPVSELYSRIEDGKNPFALTKDQLLVSISIPDTGSRSSYFKLRSRQAPDFAEASLAVASAVESGRVKYLGIAVGGVQSRPVLFDDLTQPVIGRAMTRQDVESIAEGIARSVRPVANTIFPADYRKHVLTSLVKKGLSALVPDA